MTPDGRILQINVSRGGVPKRSIQTARVTPLGLDGDAHRDTDNHGGPERALCLFSMDRIRALQAEGHPIQPGAIGENLTIEGLDWRAVTPDTHLLLGGSVLIQITRYTSPCINITASFKNGDYARVSQKRHPGDSRVYARVLVTGSIRSGDSVRLIESADVQALLAARPPRTSS